MNSYIKSKKFSRPNHNQGLAVLSMIIILSIFCLGFFYLIQTNKLVESSYQIREQEEHLQNLERSNQELEEKITHWQSLPNLEEAIQYLGMVEGNEVVYLTEDKAVAIKK